MTTFQSPYEFRKGPDGVWQRRKVGTKKWKTLHVERVDRSRIKTTRRNGKQELFEYSVNEWSWV